MSKDMEMMRKDKGWNLRWLDIRISEVKIQREKQAHRIETNNLRWLFLKGFTDLPASWVTSGRSQVKSLSLIPVGRKTLELEADIMGGSVNHSQITIEAHEQFLL